MTSFRIETPWLRGLGIAAALTTAALYGLIGLGMLSVGASTTEATTDLFGFGALMAGLYVVTAAALWLVRSRIALAAVAAFQLIPILGYVAAAGLREPPFEIWGVSIKVCQVVVLVAAGLLALGASRTHATVQQAHPKGHPA